MTQENSIYRFEVTGPVVPPVEWLVNRYRQERIETLDAIDKMDHLAAQMDAMMREINPTTPTHALLTTYAQRLRSARAYSAIQPPYPHDGSLPRLHAAVTDDLLHLLPPPPLNPAAADDDDDDDDEGDLSNAAALEAILRLAEESEMRIRAEVARLAGYVGAMEGVMVGLWGVQRGREGERDGEDAEGREKKDEVVVDEEEKEKKKDEVVSDEEEKDRKDEMAVADGQKKKDEVVSDEQERDDEVVANGEKVNEGDEAKKGDKAEE